MGLRPYLRTFALATTSLALSLSFSASAADRATGHPNEDVEARERWFAMRRDAVDGKDAWKKRMIAAEQMRANLAAGKLVTTESGDSWSSLGPSPLIDTGYPFTGRVTAIATHPTSSTVWVGTANGGVWTTADGGTTWTPKTDLQDTLAIGAIAINRTNPQIVWVGTGEANAPWCPVYGGIGLLKTTDGGATWSPMGQSVFAGSGISAVVISPANPQVMWVANRAGQHGSGVCTNSAGPYGVWNSTDGGVTWTRRLGSQTGTPDGSVSDLQVCPTSPNILLAGVPGSGVWRSTDGGATWARVTFGLPAPGAQGRVEIAFDPVTTTTVHVSEEAAAGGHLGVWKSTNLGGSFVAVGKPGAGSCQFWPISDICTYADAPIAQCFYYHDLAVAPDHDVWLAGLGVARSADGGMTWTHVCQPNVHVDQHALAFGPNGLVWLGNDGGVMTTTDDGATWTAHNAGLAVSQFNPSPAAHPANPNFLLGGTQDNGAVLYTGSSTWSLVLGGDIWRTAISSGAPDTRWYAAGTVFNVLRTFDAGAHWSLANQGIPAGENSEIDMPWTICPDDAHIFIAVTNNVWRSDNAMDDWMANSPDPLETQYDYGTATAFVAKGNGCQTYFAGFRSGALWRTLDGGASWTKIGAFAGIVSDLRSDPRSPATLWVTIQGYGVPHVWRSTNALDAVPTWTQRDAALPDTPVNAVAVDPRRSGVVWLGTDLGIFRSADDGATWSPITAGHPRAIVMGFAVGDETRELFSVTYGRGAFRLNPDCGGACPSVGSTLFGSKDPTNSTFSWGAVACSSLDRYVVLAATDFAAPFPSGWTIVDSVVGPAHVEPLSSPYVAFRVVTENACSERSN